jgi:hypothetical protein
MTSLRSLPVEDQKNIIAEHPRRELVDRAIELFAGAMSYRRAEALGHAVILLMAGIFNHAPRKYSRKHRAVYEFRPFLINSAGGPQAIMCPPPAPPSGPKSIT